MEERRPTSEEAARSTAPVRAHAEVDIAADVREVWAIIADIASWPTWNPAVRDARGGEELEVGTRFRFANPLGSFSCRVVEVDAPRLLTWSCRLLTVRQQQSWHLDQRPDGTHVTIVATMSGLSPRVFRRRHESRLNAELAALIQLVKLEAEMRALHRRQDAARAAGVVARRHDHG